ncbi:MAG: hypothetical protein ACK5NT_03760 [Pyrinomonadaceae bacterium]
MLKSFFGKLALTNIFFLFPLFVLGYSDSALNRKPFHNESVFERQRITQDEQNIVLRIKVFANPTKIDDNIDCRYSNLDGARFSPEISANYRVLFCQVIQRLSDDLNATKWSPKLSDELHSIWGVFLRERVVIKIMPKEMPEYVTLASRPFVNGESRGFNAGLFLRVENLDDDGFFLWAVHELRHIYDFYQIWDKNIPIAEADLEYNSFIAMGKLAQETSKEEDLSRLPRVWDDSWEALSENEIDAKMRKAIESFMTKHEGYRELVKNRNKFLIDFTRQRSIFDQLNKEKKENANDERIQKTSTSEFFEIF